MTIVKMSDMLALPVTRVPGGVMPFLKDSNGLVLFVGDQYHVDICVTAINEFDKHKAEIEALKAQLKLIRESYISAMGDIEVLFKIQPQSASDGSYQVDGQSCYELAMVIHNTPQQCLNSVKADAIDYAFNMIDGCDQMAKAQLMILDYTDKLRNK